MITRLINYFKKTTLSVDRIALVFAKFNEINEELSSAIKQGEFEVENHSAEIEELTRQMELKEEQISTAVAAQDKAARLINNLHKLLGE